MRLIVKLLLLSILVAAGFRLWPTTPAATSQIKPLTVVAYTSASCYKCRLDKPALDEWHKSGKYVVEYREGKGLGLPLPYYRVYEGTRFLYETHQINDL
jgi:hypothetical protein